MGKVYFLFGVHNHQPVGNFDYVFKEAYERCYFPFLSILKEFPRIKCSIHTSGPLYDWMKVNGRDYLAALKKLAARGQVEIISGAYYEPILPLIPDEDKRGQIIFMNEFIEREFKEKPQGLWLAERVWEPYLARVINRCNLKYTFLDDTHFRYAGVGRKEFFGYYTTEENAQPIFVFPISKTLRYKIPFSPAQEAVDILEGFQEESDVLVTLFDDGEKFGMWPHTYDWVYQKQWLTKFFSRLAESGKVETITPSRAIEKFPSEGIIYLPTASYEEMGGWVLDAGNALAYEKLSDFLKARGKWEQYNGFIRGGFFRNFYRKYKRLNYMHKRMFYLSKKINERTTPDKDDAVFTNLWQAQTNCGYWHGVFGGFYLGHIRASIYEHLIKAENIYDEKYKTPEVIGEEKDFDCDGSKETILKNKNIICCFSPRGGVLLELSLRRPALNLINTITRQEESYHRKIKAHAGGKKGVNSIHDIIEHKEKNLTDFLVYDKYERLGLVDHLLKKNLTVDDFAAQKGIVTLSNNIYESFLEKKKYSFNLSYRYQAHNLDFIKAIDFSRAYGWDVVYKFNNKNALNNYNFGIEFNLSLLSPQHIFKQEAKGKTPLDQRRVWEDSRSLTIIDTYKEITLQFNFDAADIFILPLYSVSSSESGFERVYQQVTVLFIIKNKEDKFNLAFRVLSSE